MGNTHKETSKQCCFPFINRVKGLFLQGDFLPLQILLWCYLDLSYGLCKGMCKTLTLSLPSNRNSCLFVLPYLLKGRKRTKTAGKCRAGDRGSTAWLCSSPKVRTAHLSGSAQDTWAGETTKAFSEPEDLIQMAAGHTVDHRAPVMTSELSQWNDPIWVRERDWKKH